ncbi:MAG: DUF1653 domain-containing protein [Patescibacteria group bacterium]|nr:DUF1653 domain-containing protein [Patescibacteria group bacterium]MDE2116513.1 DUF1653 domain-containing protein [Patescibacteria group bacterium]
MVRVSSFDSAKVPPLGVYRHYKGTDYRLVAIAEHEANGDLYAVYHAVSNPKQIWIRPLKVFIETIHVDGSTHPRFRLVS